MKTFAVFAGMLMVIGCFVGMAYALDPLDGTDAKADNDRDNLKNADEFAYGTDPNDPDSDGAGAYDGWEVWYENHPSTDLGAYHFDPNYATDEGRVVYSSPSQLIQQRDADAMMSVNDPDNDGWNNYHEFLVGSDPTNPNTDGDVYTIDSADPDPLISNTITSGGGGNEGGGSGEAQLFA